MSKFAAGMRDNQDRGPLSEDGDIWGRQLGLKFAEGIRMGTPDVQRASRRVAEVVRRLLRDR